MDSDMCGISYQLCVFVVWWTVSMRWGVWAVSEWVWTTGVRGEGCPRLFFFSSSWLINVVVGAWGPQRGWRTLCDMWRILQAAASLKVVGWDPGQRPKWEIHQECIPFRSSPSFCSLPIFRTTAVAVSLLYTSSFNLALNCGEFRLSEWPP